MLPSNLKFLYLPFFTSLYEAFACSYREAHTSLFGHIARLDATVPAHQPYGCRRTFPQEGIRVPAGRDCQVVPGKHGPLRFRMILECHRAVLLVCLHSSWPWKRDATVSEDYALMTMMMILEWARSRRRGRKKDRKTDGMHHSVMRLLGGWPCN